MPIGPARMPLFDLPGRAAHAPCPHCGQPVYCHVHLLHGNAHDHSVHVPSGV